MSVTECGMSTWSSELHWQNARCWKKSRLTTRWSPLTSLLITPAGCRLPTCTRSPRALRSKEDVSLIVILIKKWVYLPRVEFWREFWRSQNMCKFLKRLMRSPAIIHLIGRRHTLHQFGFSPASLLSARVLPNTLVTSLFMFSTDPWSLGRLARPVTARILGLSWRRKVKISFAVNSFPLSVWNIFG